MTQAKIKEFYLNLLAQGFSADGAAYLTQRTFKIGRLP